MKRLFLIVAVVLIAASVRAELVSWQYSQTLSEAPDSVRYVVYHGFDSTGSLAVAGDDSLYFTLNVQDTTINWVIAKIYWDGYSYPQSATLWLGNWWSANGSSYYYPIRYWWCDPPDSILRRIWIDNVLTYTDTIAGPIYSDIDSILITDTTGVRFSYTEFWPGGDISGWTEVVPTMSPYSVSEIIVDTIVDTIYTQFATPLDSGNVCRVYGYLSDLGEGPVNYADITAVLNGSKVVDSCGGVLMYGRRAKGNTKKNNGYFHIDLIPSSCLGGAKYTITVEKKGYENLVQEITVPDDSAYLITWED